MSVRTTVRRIGTATSGSLLVALALALPATAQAWTSNHFYSPTRNIECKFFPPPGAPYIACTTFNDGFLATIDNRYRSYHTYGNGGYGFNRYGSGPTLQYGQTYVTSYGLRCRSYTSGMKCWSRISGHGFILSRADFGQF